jgi:PIN domain nuclease of toxin-antitoxin system
VTRNCFRRSQVQVQGLAELSLLRENRFQEPSALRAVRSTDPLGRSQNTPSGLCLNRTDSLPIVVNDVIWNELKPQ